MDVYKLKIEHATGKQIDKDLFEEETRCRDPWYQDASNGRRSQFAVCPACDNPIQLIGLYELPPNVKKPFGKHTTVGVKNLAPSNLEARECCPYFHPRKHDKAARKKNFEGTPRKILTTLIEQFDRVSYIIEKQTEIKLSLNALKGMLERYRGERGYLYTGATLRNIPWVFAYMSDATGLFAQKVASNKALSEAILGKVSGAIIEDNGRLSADRSSKEKNNYIDLKMSFVNHRFTKDTEESGLIETMEMLVSLKQKNQLINIYRQPIEFDYDWFERLIQLPSDHKHRRLDRVALAEQVLSSLL